MNEKPTNGKRGSCASWRERIDLFLDDELGAADRDAVEKHLSRCAACRREVESRLALRRELAEATTIASRPKDRLAVVEAAREYLDATRAVTERTQRGWLNWLPGRAGGRRWTIADLVTGTAAAASVLLAVVLIQIESEPTSAWSNSTPVFYYSENARTTPDEGGVATDEEMLPRPY